MAGDVRLGGVAGDAVQDTIRARLSKYMNAMAIEAILLRRIRVLGEVNRPGVYYVDRTFTVRDALAQAGGVGTNGHQTIATLVRDGRGTVLEDWAMSPSGAMAIDSDDEIIVPRLPWYRRDIGSVVTTIGVLTSLIISLRR